MNTTKIRCRGSGALRTILKISGVTLLAAAGMLIVLLVQVRSSYYAGVSVDLAAGYAEQVMVAIEGHHDRQGSFPASLSELSLPAGDPGYVPKLSLDPSTGTLAVSVESEHGKFGILHFEPTTDAGVASRWRCRNVSVAADLLPAQCGR